MRDIFCNECGKRLFKTNADSDGAAGAQAQRFGYVFKMAFLFSDKYNCLFFCDKECQRKFYDKNIPKNPEVSKKLEEMKKDIPKMSKEITRGMQAIVNTINKIKKK